MVSKEKSSSASQALNKSGPSVFQVAFSDQSMNELNKLNVDEQLELVDNISNITREMLAKPREPIGKFHRDKRTYYRFRANEHRCYFEIKGDTLYSHYILHKNTVEDYIFRNKLPINEEQLFEQGNSFWKYLETLTK